MNVIIRELNDLNELLSNNQNSKKRYIQRKLNSDLERVLNKYEYMYDKYVIKNKKINSLRNEKEKEIAMVQNSIQTFFPYILAYNIAQVSDTS